MEPPEEIVDARTADFRDHFKVGDVVRFADDMPGFILLEAQPLKIHPSDTNRKIYRVTHVDNDGMDMEPVDD